MLCGNWHGHAPTIVAEALVPVAEPLVTALRAGPWARGAEVARALGRGLLPAEDPATPPEWLLPGQVPSFRRVLAALRRYRAAVLADPVGSGKTYIALAAAAALNGGRCTACLVPATLVSQWQAVAAKLGVPASIVSHQQVSRGTLPEGTSGLVVVDESHHFRHRHTRRYRNAAPWLLGRAVLLVTATPIVNRLEDLLYQLRLGVRDDALRAAGVISLRGMFDGGCASPALGELVIETTRLAPGRPARLSHTSRPEPAEYDSAATALGLIARLRLSRRPPVAALIRAGLHRAAASSPAALRGAMQRYRTLLLHARDAARAGRSLDRSEIRRLTGELDDQLVWWELLSDGGAATEIDLADLDVIDEVVADARSAEAAPDPKVERLRRILADGRPTLVFVTRRETVGHLRERLTDLPVAWCTGERGGLGRTPVPRGMVLSWFREAPATPDRPRPEVHHLIVTDVAAEGLDLQRAARVVHYDLPWTPMRLEQREGRALRLGSNHDIVEVVRFTPPPTMERALKIEDALFRKSRLPGLAGLGADGRRLWRWRAETGEALAQGATVAGVALVPVGPPGVLAGFSLYGSERPDRDRLGYSLLWIDSEGRWSESDDTVAERLAVALQHADSPTPDAERLTSGLALLAEPIRHRLALVRGRRWSMAGSSPGAQQVVGRLQSAIRRAARERNLEGLDRLERALGFVGGGHTAGEAMLLERLESSSDADLVRWAGRLPAPSRYIEVTGIRLDGLVLFAGEASPP